MLKVVAKESDLLNVQLPHECLMFQHQLEVKGKDYRATSLNWFIETIGQYNRIAYLINNQELEKRLKRAKPGDKSVPAYWKG